MKESLLAIRINGIAVSDSEPVLELEPGRLFLPAGVFRRGRLRIPSARPTHVSAVDLDYYPIDSIAGAQYILDSGTQTLDITVPSSAFTGTHLDALNNMRVAPTSPEPGLFLNHDFQSLYMGGKELVTGLVEGGFFSRFGVLTTEFAGSDLTNHFTPRRLATQFFHDFPEQMSTLTVGDSVSAVSPWAISANYAGVRYASKFTTQPTFIPVAMPGISGQAAQPSTVDLYVDNVKQLSQPVNAGPFSISNVPVMSGQGEIRLVVTDVLGRQEVITQSYIHAAQLLAKGVTDYTYEAGTLRLDYGIQSNRYTSFFGDATYRRGITDTLTIESRAEIQPGIETAGVGVVYGWRRVGVFNGGVAGSLDHARGGDLVYAGFSRSQRAFGLAAQVQEATEDFRQVGLLAQQKATKMQVQGQASLTLKNRGGVAAGYLEREGRTEQSARAATAAVNVRVGKIYLAAGGTYSFTVPRGLGLTFSVMRPMGERTVAMATGTTGANGNLASVEVDRSLPIGPGYGYRVRSTTIDQNENDAGFYYQANQGYYGIEMSRMNSEMGWRFLERGSIVFLRKHLLVSRWLNDSFGVVEVPHMKGVPVFVNNQMAGTTDGRGLLLLPWLTPYYRNVVRLDEAKLPIDVSLDLEERSVVPMARSAVFLEYKPATMGGATLILETAPGHPVPQGAVVTINKQPETYEVELRGEVFATGIDYPAAVHAEWEGGTCDVRIVKPPDDEPVPRIGPLTCKEGK